MITSGEFATWLKSLPGKEVVGDDIGMKHSQAPDNKLHRLYKANNQPATATGGKRLLWLVYTPTSTTLGEFIDGADDVWTQTWDIEISGAKLADVEAWIEKTIYHITSTQNFIITPDTESAVSMVGGVVQVEADADSKTIFYFATATITTKTYE